MVSFLGSVHSGCNFIATKDKFSENPPGQGVGGLFLQKSVRTSLIGILISLLEPVRRWLRESGQVWVPVQVSLIPRVCKHSQVHADCLFLFVEFASWHCRAGGFFQLRLVVERSAVHPGTWDSLLLPHGHLNRRLTGLHMNLGARGS